MKDAIPYLILFTITVICVLVIPKRGSSSAEESPATYDAFVDENGTHVFDPVGASSILSRMTQSRDGYEYWWNFKIGATDFDNLANSIAVNNNGPVKLSWQLHSLPPASWKPDGPAPKWWQLPTTSKIESKSTSWCFDYITDGRHKGWFLAFDRTNSVASIWHWNHQWLDHECEELGMANSQDVSPK